MRDYTLPPLAPNESDPIRLWAEIARLRSAVEGPQGYATWQDAATDERLKRVAAEAARAPLLARIAELEELLRFVERWASHHGTNPRTTAQEALSMIQHHPSIKDITRSYADGKVPETFDPYARIAELEAENERAWTAANRAESKVKAWEQTMVVIGLPMRRFPGAGWGPGADEPVDIPVPTPERLTSILDRMASMQAQIAVMKESGDA